MTLRTIVLAMAAAGGLLAASPGELAGFRHIYIMPMGFGLEQYLANRLTATGHFVVVNDPAAADAIFTDRVGESIQTRIKELNAPPPPPEPVKKADAKTEKEEEAKPAGIDLKGDTYTRPSTFGRGRGNVFLLDRKTGHVVWSVYQRPKSSAPDDLNKTADKIIDRFRAAAFPKQ